MMNTLTKHWTIFSAAVLALGVLWIAFTAANLRGAAAVQSPAPMQGFPAPDFALKTRDGQEIRLSDYRGRPVIINFWASWCPSCKAEMPDLQKSFEYIKTQDVVILGVNAANQDTLENALEFINQYGLTFPVVYDVNGAAAQLYAVHALPTTFFIDKTGIIQEIVVGGPMSQAGIFARVSALLNKAP